MTHKILIFACFTCFLISCQAWNCSGEAWLCQDCVTAGQMSDEKLRYKLMVETREKVENETEVAEELDSIISIIDHWANGLERYWSSADDQLTGEDGYLGGWFMFRATPWAPIWPKEPLPSSPVHPLWSLYRGRMLIWNAVENGFQTNEFYSEGLKLLKEAREVFVENPVVKMYFEESWTAKKKTKGEEYPEGWDWVGPQHIALSSLTHVMRYWCQYRQAPDGQLGGGWGDDVEVWRNWVSILIGFSEEDLEECWKNVATGALSRPRMTGGYTDHLTDVEHSAEETGDTLTSLLLLDSTNDTWKEWAGGRLVFLAENLWMGINHHGRRQFKSTYFTSKRVSENSLFACDTAYHSRALQPALLAWQMGDYRPGGIILEWLETYLFASETEERGKPKGIVPSAISWPSGRVGGWLTNSWDKPGCHYSDKTYAWPRGVDNVLKSMLLAYHLTGSERFLDPIKVIAELAKQNREIETRGIKVEEILAMYRDVSGDTQYDNQIFASGNTYLRYLIKGELSGFEPQLQQNVNLLTGHEQMLTSEVRFSDRIFMFKDAFIDKHFNNSLKTSANFDLLYSMVTGSVGTSFYFPRPYVKWNMHPEEISVLVRRTISPKSLEIRLWSHVDEEIVVIKFKLQNIEATGEESELTCNQRILNHSLQEDQYGSISIEIPSQTPCILKIPVN